MRKKLFKIEVGGQPYYVCAFRVSNAIDFAYYALNKSGIVIAKKEIRRLIKREAFPLELRTVQPIDDFSKSFPTFSNIKIT